MKIKDIISCIEEYAPPALQENYDNSGLITGNKEDEATGVIVCLDSTPDVIDEAAGKKCNLVIAHHPVIFGGLNKVTGDNYVGQTIIKAIRSNIAIYAAHTNLDNVINGVNSRIAEKLGLVNCRTLSPRSGLLRKLVTFCPSAEAESVRQALFKAGAGIIGKYGECSFNSEGMGTFKASEGTNPYVGKANIRHHEAETKIETIYPAHIEKKVLRSLFESHPYEEVAYDIYRIENPTPWAGAGLAGELRKSTDARTFLAHIKKVMQAKCVRHTKPAGKKVRTVAVCGGSGSFLLKDAIAAGADVFVSSDFKYHQFFDANGKIMIADIGHYESEQFTKELLHELLSKKFPTFAVHLSKIITNPINYL